MMSSRDARDPRELHAKHMQATTDFHACMTRAYLPLIAEDEDEDHDGDSAEDGDNYKAPDLPPTSISRQVTATDLKTTFRIVLAKCGIPSAKFLQRMCSDSSVEQNVRRQMTERCFLAAAAYSALTRVHGMLTCRTPFKDTLDSGTPLNPRVSAEHLEWLTACGSEDSDSAFKDFSELMDRLQLFSSLVQKGLSDGTVLPADEILHAIDKQAHALYVSFQIRLAPASDRAWRTQISLEDEVYSESDSADEELNPGQRLQDAYEVRLSRWWGQATGYMNQRVLASTLTKTEEDSWSAFRREVSLILTNDTGPGERLRLLQAAMRSLHACNDGWAIDLVQSFKLASTPLAQQKLLG